MLKVMNPRDVRKGDLVYCGITGKKVWRRIIGIDVKSYYRYSVHFDDDYSVSYGSGCKMLVKHNKLINTF